MNWKRNTAKRIIAAFGGKCGSCGYDRCETNLILHLIDKDDKTDKAPSLHSLPTTSWDNLVGRAKKCILLCRNCSGEVKEEMREIYGAALFYEAQRDE